MKIIHSQTNKQIFDPDLENGYLLETEWVPPYLEETIDHVNKFAYADDDYETVLMYFPYTDLDREMINGSKAAEKESSVIEKIVSMFSETTVPSDKIGYDWKISKIGNVEIMREYVENNEVGIMKDGSDFVKAIEYTLGMAVTKDLWYTSDGWVWLAIKDGVPSGINDAEYFDVF